MIRFEFIYQGDSVISRHTFRRKDSEFPEVSRENFYTDPFHNLDFLYKVDLIDHHPVLQYLALFESNPQCTLLRKNTEQATSLLHFIYPGYQ